jgi:DNA-binding transcriptional LysR family regulator
MLNWDDLRIFLALARNDRLNAAAKLVGLDATTVSRRMARLGDSLQATLFEHYHGGHVLTARGKELLARAERMESEMLAAQELSVTHGDGGRVRVSVSEAFGLFLARRLHTFHEEHPEIALDLAMAATARLSPSKREADIALTMIKPERGSVTIRKFATPTNHLYASQAYLDRHPPIRSIPDLRRHTLIGYISDLLYTKQMKYFSELGLGREPDVRTSSILAQRALVQSGVGVGVLPRFLAQPHPELIQILSDQVRVERTLWILVHQDVRQLPRVKTVIAWLTRQANENRTLLTGEPVERPAASTTETEARRMTRAVPRKPRKAETQIPVHTIGPQP